MLAHLTDLKVTRALTFACSILVLFAYSKISLPLLIPGIITALVAEWRMPRGLSATDFEREIATRFVGVSIFLGILVELISVITMHVDFNWIVAFVNSLVILMFGITGWLFIWARDL